MYPIRSCVKNTGPGETILMRRAIPANNGSNVGNANRRQEISRIRFSSGTFATGISERGEKSCLLKLRIVSKFAACLCILFARPISLSRVSVVKNSGKAPHLVAEPTFLKNRVRHSNHDENGTTQADYPNVPDEQIPLRESLTQSVAVILQ